MQVFNLKKAWEEEEEKASHWCDRGAFSLLQLESSSASAATGEKVKAPLVTDRLDGKNKIHLSDFAPPLHLDKCRCSMDSRLAKRVCIRSVEEREELKENVKVTTLGKATATMGQSYAKYCHIHNMVKHPVDAFEDTRGRREALHGKCDFALVVKDTRFHCHKLVLMGASR